MVLLFRIKRHVNAWWQSLLGGVIMLSMLQKHEVFWGPSLESLSGTELRLSRLRHQSSLGSAELGRLLPAKGKLSKTESKGTPVKWMLGLTQWFKAFEPAAKGW